MKKEWLFFCAPLCSGLYRFAVCAQPRLVAGNYSYRAHRTHAAAAAVTAEYFVRLLPATCSSHFYSTLQLLTHRFTQKKC